MQPGCEGHEVRHQILLLALLLIELLILSPEPLEHIEVGLSHIVQHRGHTVLRGHLQLSADVVVHQFPEKNPDFCPAKDNRSEYRCGRTPSSRHPPAAGAKSAVYSGVVGVQIPAWLRGQTAAPLHPPPLLLGAGGVAEVGGGTSHIVDIALELRVLRQRSASRTTDSMEREVTMRP